MALQHSLEFLILPCTADEALVSLFYALCVTGYDSLWSTMKHRILHRHFVGLRRETGPLFVLWTTTQRSAVIHPKLGAKFGACPRWCGLAGCQSGQHFPFIPPTHKFRVIWLAPLEGTASETWGIFLNPGFCTRVRGGQRRALVSIPGPSSP